MAYNWTENTDHSPLLTFQKQDEQWRVPASVHPIEDLLELEAEQILERYRRMQRDDFDRVFGELRESGGSVAEQLPRLNAMLGEHPANELNRVCSLDNMHGLFSELHEHVMHHPVWLHPFFKRFFRGPLTDEQLARFARHYLNQVKNTRQCVALSLGRFHSLADLPYGPLNEVVSEMVQLVLAELLADEYGTHDVSMHDAEQFSLAELFSPVTHITLYRRLFALLDIDEPQQDVPMLHGCADNVLVQRLLAGDARFTPLESLASVGLGMEWGVPAFFSLLLGGIVRHGIDNGLALNHDHVSVFTGHVQQDVAHSIAVMTVTAMLAPGERDTGVIKNATNMLMASRYQMVSDLYNAVFGEPCESIHDIGLEERYRVDDPRIADALREARRHTRPASVADHAGYVSMQQTPFVPAE